VQDFLIKTYKEIVKIFLGAMLKKKQSFVSSKCLSNKPECLSQADPKCSSDKYSSSLKNIG